MLFRSFKKHIPVIILALLMGSTVVLISTFLPKIIRMLTDYCLVIAVNRQESGIFAFLVDGKFGKAGSLQLLITLVLFYLCLLFVRHIFLYLKYYIAKFQSTKLDGEFRKISFEKILVDNRSVSANFNNGELMQILDCNTINFKDLYFFQLPLVYDYILSITLSAVMLAGVNIYLMLISLSLLPLIVIILIKLFKAYGESGEMLWKKSSQLRKAVQEKIYGIRLVKSLVREGYEGEKFNHINNEYKKINIARVDIISKYSFLLNLFYNLPYAIAVGAGALMVIKETISAGEYISFTLYMTMVMSGVLGLVDVLANIQQSLIEGSKLQKLMTLKTDKGENSILTVGNMPVIKIENVSCKIGEKTILSNINLEIKNGQKVGIIGEAGSGKSALLNLISGYLDCSEGTVLIDEKPIENIAKDELNRIFSYSFQDNFLFSDSIKNNVLMYMQDDDEVLEKALKTAEAWDFVSGMEEGTNSLVGERGVGLSGGQRQRIAIARAIAKNSPILILDDSLSAVDRRTEYSILNNLHNEFAEKTLLMVVNKVSSLKNFDMILYMEKGAIIERGTFEQLINIKGKTADLYQIQMMQGGDENEE